MLCAALIVDSGGMCSNENREGEVGFSCERRKRRRWFALVLGFLLDGIP